MKRRRYRPPLTARQRAGLLCLLLSAAAVALLAVGTVHLQAMLGDLAVTRVSNTVNRLVVAAVSEAVNAGETRYDALITLRTDEAGHVTALQSDMAAFNRLQSDITADILARLGEVSDTTLSIPLGTLTGSALLAGRGPRFSVRMQSVGSCAAHFENRFEHAGINQTTHSVVLCVDVSVTILLPGVRTAARVSNDFSVAETVIVGAVPDSYTYFQSDQPEEEMANEYIMNNA